MTVIKRDNKMAKTVDEIAEILDEMRLEGERNTENFQKALMGINSKLELMNNDDGEVVRVYISELIKAIEDRHALALVKFDEIQKNIADSKNSQNELAKSDELKILFNSLSADFNNFVKETQNRKLILDDIQDKLSSINNRAFDKTEITDLIHRLSSDLLVINENINKKLIETAEAVNNLNSLEKLDGIARQISGLSYDLSSQISSIPKFDNIEDKLKKLIVKFIKFSYSNIFSLY